MKVRMDMALSIMLARALGHVRIRNRTVCGAWWVLHNTRRQSQETGSSAEDDRVGKNTVGMAQDTMTRSMHANDEPEAGSRLLERPSRTRTTSRNGHSENGSSMRGLDIKGVRGYT